MARALAAEVGAAAPRTEALVRAVEDVRAAATLEPVLGAMRDLCRSVRAA